MNQNQKKMFGIRVSALIEMVVGLVVLLLIDAMFAGGHRFWGIDPHPFWIIVIVMAAHYGTNEGLLAAVLCIAVYLLGNIPPQGETDRYDYLLEICLNPVMWIFAGWGLGELRMRHVRERNRLMKELDDSREREETISESYKFVKSRKENLEVQLSGKLTSSVNAYRAAKEIETLDPKEVLKGVEDLVSAVLGADKFSLYLLHDNKLTATLLHGWNKSDAFSKDLDNFSPLYQAVVGNQNTLCVANEDQEPALDRQGILAGPIMDPVSRRVVGMLKIERMEFANLGLNTVETFRALCDWIGTAMVNARNYQTVKSESMLNPEHNMMTFNFFKRQSDFLGSLAKRVGFDLSMLVVRMNDVSKLPANDRVAIARQLSTSVKSVLRSVDMAFEHQTDGEEFSILLPATSQAGANIVRDKLVKDLEKNLRNFRHVNISYVVQAIHATA